MPITAFFNSFLTEDRPYIPWILLLTNRMPKLNYRAFEATIVLKSYCDRFIGMFDGEELFQGLYDEAEDLDMIRCNNGLCFKKGISVRGCHCKFTSFLFCYIVFESPDLCCCCCCCC